MPSRSIIRIKMVKIRKNWLKISKNGKKTAVFAIFYRFFGKSGVRSRFSSFGFGWPVPFPDRTAESRFATGNSDPRRLSTGSASVDRSLRVRMESAPSPDRRGAFGHPEFQIPRATGVRVLQRGNLGRYPWVKIMRNRARRQFQSASRDSPQQGARPEIRAGKSGRDKGACAPGWCRTARARSRRRGVLFVR